MIGFLYAIGAAITWGAVYTIDQKILYALSPLALLFVNSVITMIVVLPFLFTHGGGAATKAFLHSGTSTIILIALSLALAALANFLIYSSIKTLGASTASIFEIAYPFFVVILSFFVFRSKPNIYFLIGALFMFIGSAIIIKLGR